MLFGETIFNEGVAESQDSCIPLYWLLLVLTLPVFHFSFPKQLKTHSARSGWAFALTGLLCLGSIMYTGLTRLPYSGGNPLSPLIFPGIIFVVTGTWCLIAKKFSARKS
ncbi:MAG: hypothetical protein WB502_03525 [Thermoactinomyces sp.]